MNKLVKLYQRSSWHAVYNTLTTGGRARSSLLVSIVAQSVVNGFAAGFFYTGLLVGYGINIVNISILSSIPGICSVFSILSPLVLSRFKKRRVIMTVTRFLYYLINIMGITLLPQLVSSESGRIAGLIAIVFTSNAINAIFSPGYSPWHMHYITEDIRTNYFSSRQLMAMISTSVVMIAASLLTDRLEGEAQLNVIVILRHIAFAVAILDVYFMQKPREPEYKHSTNRLSLAKVFKIPLSNKRFMLILLINAMFVFPNNISASVQNAWLLEDVQVSYLYITLINGMYTFFIPATSPFWNRMMRKRGTFATLGISLLLHAPTFFAFAWVNNGNYLWLMSIIRLTQHCLGIGIAFSVNSLIYEGMPETDQDSYLSLYNLAANGANFLTMSIATGVVAAMGDGALRLLGYTFTSVPVLLLIQAGLYVLVGVFVMFVRPWLDATAPQKQ